MFFFVLHILSGELRVPTSIVVMNVGGTGL